jgi:solute carrier family 25 carnitine/acylcarnitine transporter 20/29
MKHVVEKQGFLALYRGLLPPLGGSIVFRSVQFSTYIGTYAALEDREALTRPVPWLGGLQLRVVLAALAASSVRTVIETPLEHIKVRKQTGQPWMKHASVSEALRHPTQELLNAYGGVGVTWARTTVLMTTFFIMVDSIVRWAPEVFTYPIIGPFAKGGVCATIAWGACFPLEVAKSRVQAAALPTTMRAELATVVREQGVAGLYRGFGPGAARSIFANGTSMVVFAYCQSCFATMDAIR